MVELKNIKKNNDTISCDYFPEGKTIGGFLEVDRNGDIVRLELAENEIRTMYASFASGRLTELLTGDGEIPESATVFWY